MNGERAARLESKPKVTDLDPDELAELEPADWARFDRGSIEALDFSKVPDDALPGEKRCPRWHWPVLLETVRGPGAVVLSPCGCRVGMEG